jgi:hypothetical protein
MRGLVTCILDCTQKRMMARIGRLHSAVLWDLLEPLFVFPVGSIHYKL